MIKYTTTYVLTVENSIEIGKVYQVIEKWVFFKLLFQILQTDSSGGKNHSPSKNTIYFLQGKFKFKEPYQSYQNQISQYKIQIINEPLFHFVSGQLLWLPLEDLFISSSVFTTRRSTVHIYST